MQSLLSDRLLSDEDFVRPPDYDPIIQKPLPETYDEGLKMGVVVPCAKSSGNLTATLGSVIKL